MRFWRDDNQRLVFDGDTALLPESDEGDLTDVTVYVPLPTLRNGYSEARSFGIIRSTTRPLRRVRPEDAGRRPGD